MVFVLNNPVNIALTKVSSSGYQSASSCCGSHSVQFDKYLARETNICLPEIRHSLLWHDIRLSSWVTSGGDEDSINRRIFSPACSLSFSFLLTNPSSLASRNTFQLNKPLEKEKQINRRLEKVEYKLGEPFQAQWSVRNRPLFFSPFKLL